MSHACIACASHATSAVVAIRDLPVYCNVLWETRKQALAAPRGNIDLHFCRSCGHLYNAAFDPELVEYTPDYENSLHYSPRFQRYADTLIERLIRRYDIRGRQVVEIGCGKGEFLRLLCARGDNRGVGFDPSYDAARDDGSSGKVTFVKDYYSAHYSHLEPNLVCCRHVLEHVPDPARFLAELRDNPGITADTVLYVEVPNSLFTVRDMGIWDLIYEHVSYFTRDSLRSLFETAGFDILDLAEDFGGQFLYVEARLSTRSDEPGPSVPGSSLDGLISEFAHRYESRVAQWREQLETMTRNGGTCVIWGAGSKGITFANIMRGSDAIIGMVDINPHKLGRFVPGTGTRVVGVETLAGLAPDHVLVTNPLYLEEIRQAMTAQGIRAKTMLV